MTNYLTKTKLNAGKRSMFAGLLLAVFFSGPGTLAAQSKSNGGDNSTTVTACESYEWFGETYTESGTYTHTVKDGNGPSNPLQLFEVCHKNPDGSVKTIYVDFFSLFIHIFHGDKVGSCVPPVKHTLILTINKSTSSSSAEVACDSYEWNGEVYTESGIYTFNTTNAAGCDSTATLNLTINKCNQGGGCYASEVVLFNQGLTKIGTAPNAERSIPTNALGAPDGQSPAIYAPVQNFVSLGFGGEIILSFPYPIANGPGADIKIWESSASPNAEKSTIEVSQDGLGYVAVGTISQTGEVDFDAAFGDYIQFVRIVDVSNPAQFSNSQIQDGFDVDAVECLHGEYIPSCVATEVISFNQGLNSNGGAVAGDRSVPANALGAIKPSIPGTVNFFSLGFGGEIIVAFDGPVANGPGDDIRIGEVTWGYNCATYPESIEVFASQDGVSYVHLGSSCMTGSFDLGVLSWAQFIKIVDISDASLFPAGADGYDVSGVECLNGPAQDPGDDGLEPCTMQSVVVYAPGLRKNGLPVAGNRNDPNKALGAPQDNDTYNFAALGFGGSITLGFDYVVFNLAGNDVKVFETSFGSPTCNRYPEKAIVEASKDLISWTNLGALCLDGEVDLGSLSWAQYFRITDMSDASKFGGNDDGFDVDAIVVINGGCANGPRRLAVDGEMASEDAAFVSASLYPNPAAEFTMVQLRNTSRGTTWNLDVVDAAGRIVEHKTFNGDEAVTEYQLQVSHLETGIYQVVITGEDQKHVLRLIK